MKILRNDWLLLICFLLVAVTLSSCARGSSRGLRLQIMSQELAMTGQWKQALDLARKIEGNQSSEMMAENLTQDEIRALLRVYSQLGNHEKVFEIGDAFITHLSGILDAYAVRNEYSIFTGTQGHIWELIKLPLVMAGYLESALRTGEFQRFDKALKMAHKAMEYSMDMIELPDQPRPENCRYSYWYGAVQPLIVQRALLDRDSQKTFRALEDVRITMEKMERCMPKRHWKLAKAGYQSGLLALGVQLKDPVMLRTYGINSNDVDVQGSSGFAAFEVVTLPFTLLLAGEEALYSPGRTLKDKNIFFRTRKEFYLGYADYLEGKYEVAVEKIGDYCRAMEGNTGLGGEYLWIAYDALADCYERLGKPSNAITHYEKAVAIAETERTALKKDSYKRRFLKDRGRPYERLAILYAKENQVEKAFAVVEKAKARALADLLEGKAVGKTREVEASFLAYQRENVLKSSLGGVFDGQNQNRSLAAQQELEAGDRELASMVTAQSPAWDTVAPYFKEATLVEFMLGERSGLVFVGDGNGLRVHSIPIPEQRIADKVSTLRKKIYTRSATVRATAQTLYKDLLGQAFPTGLPERVVIVPHGPLHNLPFTALHDGRGWLIEGAEISTLPAAGILSFCRAKKVDRIKRFLAFGNPDLTGTLDGVAREQWSLPGAEAEVRHLGDLFAGFESRPEVKVLTDAQATEPAFAKEAPKADIVHLACHGEFNTQSPSRSALLLADSPGYDGRLEVWEIMKVALNARLVVMSACETGIGDVGVGDDVVGLSRGMLYAGTPSLMSSLWMVSDQATSLLMMNFYDYLIQGERPTRALQLAQLSLLKKQAQVSECERRGFTVANSGGGVHTDNFEHPFYWAAFQVAGDFD